MEIVLLILILLLTALLIYGVRLGKAWKKRVSMLERDLAATALELARREKRIRQETEEQVTKTAEQTEQLLQARFTIVAEKTEIACALDWDGNCIVSRAVDGLKVGHGLKLEFMDVAASSSTPDSRFEAARIVEDRSTDGVQMEVLDASKPNKRVFRIRFPEGAANRPEGVSYALEYEMLKGFLMTKEEALAAYRGESPESEAYFHRNDISTRSLSIELRFPDGYDAVIHPIALINNAVHEGITKQLKVEKQGNCFYLQVTKPLQGFAYMLAWDAPTREEFARKRHFAATAAAAIS